MINAIITGATGMVGGIVQQQCLNSDRIDRLVSLTRRASGWDNKKLDEIIVEDFCDLSGHVEAFSNIHVAYFCLGVYTGAVSREKFKEITVDYTVEFVNRLVEHSPGAILCFLSGSGADTSETSKVMFAHDKGVAENYISRKVKTAYIFRPGYIYPVTPRKEPNMMYKISRSLYPVIKLFGKNASITSVDLANAIFKIGLDGHDKTVLENRDIVEFTT